MLTIIIFLAILRVISTKPNGILMSHDQYGKYKDEMKFWGITSCQAGSRRTFSIHESPRTSSSSPLYDFFGALVSNVQTKCDSTMKTKYYLIDDDDRNDTKQLNSLYGGVSFTNQPNIVQESGDIRTTELGREIHLFPYKDVDIVLMTVQNSVRTLMNGNVFDDFNNRRHVLVLMISESNDPHKSVETLKNTFVVLLQRLWQERGILNVFFAAPFSSLGCQIWFYDPFFNNPITGIRGKILAMGIESISTVDRVKDLNGHTLNIGMFEIAPAAIKLDAALTGKTPFAQNSQGFGGIDGITMAVIAERMNFALNIIPPTDGVEFGYVCENGTFVGTIGDAAYHRIDISFNSMYMKLYTTLEKETDIIELTVPIDFDRLCVIVPRAKKVPRWLRTFYHFDLAIWGCILLTQILISLVWYFLRKFQRSPREGLKKTTTYEAYLLDTFLMFLGAPVKVDTTQTERLMLSALMLLGLTVMGMFTGTLYQSFTSEMHYKEINTLKKVDESGIAIGTASPNLHDVFGSEETADEVEEVKSLRRKLRILDYDGGATIEKTAHQRNIASLSRQHSFLVLIYRYVDDDGVSLLHEVEECPRSYYLSYVVPKDSVYINRLNYLIRRLQEAGLPALWDSVTTNKLVVEENAKANLKRVKSMHSSFNIHDMQTSFFILFIGHVMAIVVLIGEICYSRKNQMALKIRHRTWVEINVLAIPFTRRRSYALITMDNVYTQGFEKTKIYRVYLPDTFLMLVGDSVRVQTSQAVRMMMLSAFLLLGLMVFGMCIYATKI